MSLVRAATYDELLAIAAGQDAGVIGYPTRADLEADLAHDEDAVAYVTNDSTPSNNGVYRKVGESGVGTWSQSSFDRVALVEASVADANALVEQIANLVPGDVVSTEDSITLPGATESNTSTFSGWGTAVGPKKDFNRISFYVQSWDETTPVTQVRVQVRIGDYQGEVLADKTVDVSPPADTDYLVEIDLDARVTNEAADDLWIMWWANGRTGVRRNNNDTAYPESSGYPRARYATAASVETLTSFAASGAQNHFIRLTNVANPTPVATSSFAASVAEQIAGSREDVYGRWLMRDWRAQLGKIRVGTSAQAVLALFGDSWINGRERLALPLSDLLKADFGSAGAGWCGFAASHGAADNAEVSFSRSGTWTDSDQQAGSRGPDIAHTVSSDVGALITVNALVAATDFVIHYFKQVGGGDFRWRVDGGSWATVQTHAANAHATVAINGLSDSTHTLEIEVIAAESAGVMMMGVDVQHTDSGVRIHKLGNGGLTAAQAVAVTASVWQAGITTLAPNAVGILLGTNDMSNDVALDTFKTQITTLVGRARTAAPLADMFLIAPADNALTGTLHTMDEYSQALLEVALAEDCAYVDLYRNFGPYDDANARGLYSDTVHPNADGGRQIASLVYDRLLSMR